MSVEMTKPRQRRRSPAPFVIKDRLREDGTQEPTCLDFFLRFKRGQLPANPVNHRTERGAADERRHRVVQHHLENHHVPRTVGNDQERDDENPHREAERQTNSASEAR